MPPEAMCKSETRSCSLTDQILILCMSGGFGVREAIAEALKHRRIRKRRPIRRERMHEQRPPPASLSLKSTQGEGSR
jgi:hypothetical protein